MTEQEILLKIQDVISSVLEEKTELHLEDNLLEDVGLVSISYVETIVEVEEAFGISFSDDVLIYGIFVTVQDIVTAVQQLI